MDTQAEQLLQTALTLSPNDRAEIAAQLLESLDGEPDQDVEAAWAAEIKRRIDQIDRGEVELVPWEEVLRSMRERLNG